MQERDIRDQRAILGVAPSSRLRRDHREWSNQLAMETRAQTPHPQQSRENRDTIELRSLFRELFISPTRLVGCATTPDGLYPSVWVGGWMIAPATCTITNQVSETPATRSSSQPRVDDNAFPKR